MSIIVMRHAEACWGKLSDKERSLTDVGKTQVNSTISQLIEGGYIADKVCTSPYLRARETGEVAARLFACKEVYVQQELSPNASGKSAIHSLSKHGVTLLVSHMPLVSTIIRLMCGDKLPAEVAGGFRLAQAVVVAFDDEVCIGLGRPCKLVIPLCSRFLRS